MTLLSMIIVFGGIILSITIFMILGFLIEKPMSAYEVKKTAEQRNLYWWISGSTPTIYRNISALEDKGYIDGKVVREGEMPEKTVYTINESGRIFFKELAEKYSTEPPQVYLDFTAIISNINKLDETTAKKNIKQLYNAFCSNIKTLESVKDSFEPYPARSVITLSEDMNKLFCSWLRSFYEDYFEEEFDSSAIN